MTINEQQDEIIEDFSMAENYDDKYMMLIEYSRENPPLDPQYKTETYRVEGCQSNAWLVAELRDGRVYYQVQAEAQIINGLVTLIVRVLNGHTPQEILDADLYFIEAIGMKDHLSPLRSNGLQALVKQMRMYALAFGVKN